MVNFGLSHHGSCACRFPEENNQRPVVPEIPSHTYVAIHKQSYHMPPHVVDGYDHEKALLVWFASKVYIEEARLAKTNPDKITEAKNAEMAGIEMAGKIVAKTRKAKRAATMKRAGRLRVMGIKKRAAEKRRREMKKAEGVVVDSAARNELMATMGRRVRMDV